MRTRQDIEQQEQKALAPYAMKSCESAGRVFPEEKHFFRTCYQRDRDRIIHCEAFRKLEYKTQVFVISEGDYYRTRLTHTIEVAQIARTIGRALQLNEELIEAIALAHDLGHPPFGHAGEYALNDIMKQADSDAGFNHNLRSFEIVRVFEKRYPHFDGLNLSEEVLVGILKHNTDYDEEGVIDEYANKGTTLEAKVVDIADSLAYLSHDIDDGLTSGCIVEEELMDSELWKKAISAVPDISQHWSKEMLKYQIVKAIIDIQIRDLLTYSDQRLKEANFSSSQEVKNYHANSLNPPIIGFSPELKKQRQTLQKLLNVKFYHHYRVVRMTDKARRIINDLFSVYLNTPSQLPYQIYDREKEYSQKKKFEVICNYIASMTDRSAIDEHKKLFDPYQKV
jgi:dGTPase